jgi:hypothetical protein
MEIKTFYTVVKFDHKLGGNSYVRGRIHGIMEAICCENPGEEVLMGIGDFDLGAIYPVKTTTEKYERFAEIVEKSYKGLCIFDYKESE